MWNGITNSWETLDSNSAKGASEDFSLYGEVTDTAYYDFRQTAAEVAIRVYQQNTSGSAKILTVDLVQISFLIQYADKYASREVRYTDKFSKRPKVYTPKFPHENPQDDAEGEKF